MSESKTGETTSLRELRYENIRAEWADEMQALEIATFPTIARRHLYARNELVFLAEKFPDGGFATFDGDRIIAMGLGLQTTFDFDHPAHALEGLYSSHDPDGDWYYGTTIAVNPNYRGRGIGHKLYDLRKECTRIHNLRGIVAGGVLPGYRNHINDMSATEYIDRVRAGELYDPTLTFQLENGFEAVCVLENYLEDPSVGNNAVLIVWHNPDFQPDPNKEPPLDDV